MFSVKWGEIAVTRGYDISIVEMRGIPPPTCQKEGSQDPSCAAVPLAPATCPKKSEKCVHPRHGLRAPCERVIIKFAQVGARGSVFRGRVLPIPPSGWKRGVIPPFDHLRFENVMGWAGPRPVR